jgi:HEPN domain-containing protein
MEKQTQEWLKQSHYDMDTAEYMLEGGRRIYAVFMCHLAIEKALKGLYYENRREFPPKSHNLIYLLNQIGIRPPEDPG